MGRRRPNIHQHGRWASFVGPTYELAGRLDTPLADGLEAMCFNPVNQLPAPLRRMLQSNVWTQHAVALLLQWLGEPAENDGNSPIHPWVRHAGATAFRMLPHPARPELADARVTLARFWDGLGSLPCERPAQSVACGNLNDPALLLRYWWPSVLADPKAPIPPSPGFLIHDDTEARDESERHLTWRRWLWFFNIFQMLPGFLLATRTGLAAGDHEALTLSSSPRAGTGGAPGAAHAAAWESVIAQAMGSLAEGLRILMAAGCPPPDEVGYELQQAGHVVAEAELAWISRQQVLLMPTHAESASVWEAQGWRTRVANPEWPQRLVDDLRG